MAIAQNAELQRLHSILQTELARLAAMGLSPPPLTANRGGPGFFSGNPGEALLELEQMLQGGGRLTPEQEAQLRERLPGMQSGVQAWAAASEKMIRDTLAVRTGSKSVVVDASGQPIAKKPSVWPWVIAGVLAVGAGYVVYRVAKR